MGISDVSYTFRFSAGDEVTLQFLESQVFHEKGVHDVYCILQKGPFRQFCFPDKNKWTPLVVPQRGVFPCPLSCEFTLTEGQRESNDYL